MLGLWHHVRILISCYHAPGVGLYDGYMYMGLFAYSISSPLPVWLWLRFSRYHGQMQVR